MFGGAGLYNQEIKKRQTFDDLLLYDMTTNLWLDPVRERDHPRLLALATPGTSQSFDDSELQQF